MSEVPQEIYLEMKGIESRLMEKITQQQALIASYKTAQEYLHDKVKLLNLEYGGLRDTIVELRKTEQELSEELCNLRMELKTKLSNLN